MAQPTFVLAEKNGPSTGTWTNNVGAVNFASIDEPSNTANLMPNYPIVTGSNSFEKYNALQVTGVAPTTLSSFMLWFNSTKPEDGALSNASIAMVYGVTTTYTPPVATSSTVATSLCSSNTNSPGVSFAAPANSIGAYSGFIVEQLQFNSAGIGGVATWPSPWCTVSYLYS